MHIFCCCIVNKKKKQLLVLNSVCFVPESGTRGNESRSFLLFLFEEDDGESWYSW